MEHRRVVVTGMGIVSPVGLNVSTAWGNLIAGRSGIGPITLFDASNLHAPDPACDPDFVPSQARHAKVEVAMSNSFGLGSQDATLVLRACHE